MVDMCYRDVTIHYTLKLRSNEMSKEVKVSDILAPIYTVPFAGRRSACEAWIDRHGIGEIYPDYDGCWQVRVFLS